MAWQTTPSSLSFSTWSIGHFISLLQRRQNSESWKRRIGNWNEPLHTMLGIPSTSLSIIVFFPEKWAEVYGLFRAFGRVKPRMLYIGVTCVLCEKSCDPHGRCDVFFLSFSLFYIARSRLRVAFESYFTIVWLGILFFFGRLDKCEMRKIDGSSETKLDILWMFTQTNDERRRRRTVRATTKLSRQARSLQLSSATKKKS